MDTLKRLLGYTKHYWKLLLVSGAASTLYGTFSAAPTYIIQHIIDKVFIGKASNLLIPFIALFIGLFLVKALFMYLSNYYMNLVGIKVVNDIRAQLFEKIIFFPTSFYEKKTTGQLMAYFLSDIGMIQNAASACIKNGVRSFFEAISLIAVAFLQNPPLAALMLIFAPLIGLTIQKMGDQMRTTSSQSQDKIGSIGSILQEIIVGIREIKSFNAEKTEIKRFSNSLDNYFTSFMKNVIAISLTPAFIEVIAMSGIGIIFYIASTQVISGSITPGQLASFFAAVMLAYQPLKRLINVYSDMQSGLAAAQRVFDVMDYSFPAIHNRELELESFEDKIHFSNLSFSYDPQHPVLKNLNLTIKKGENIGIVGPSGAGKSTLCDLLLGFIQPTQGTIFLDDQDITQISLSSLRRQIGYVSQKTFLFNDTVRANISYANPNVSALQILAACKAANAHQFIESLPDGYDTVVGENGMLLSGGQKQRLTIARALLKNPQILIFDEATSALDQKSEKMISDSIREIGRNKTIIIISHRPSLIEGLSRVFSIQDGQVVEVAAAKLPINASSLRE